MSVTRTVRIPSAGVEWGWRRIIEIERTWTCPVCEGRRGEVYPAIAFDGRHRMHVDGWVNPCGHTDLYADIERETLLR